MGYCIAFGINSTCNAGRKLAAPRTITIFLPPALLALLIPNTIGTHTITHTSAINLCLIYVRMLLLNSQYCLVHMFAQAQLQLGSYVHTCTNEALCCISLVG